MKALQPFCHLALFLIAALLLTGCGKNKEIDGEKADVAANKQQIAALAADLAASKQQIATLKADLAEVRATVTTIGEGQRKNASKDEHPTIAQEQIAQLNKTITDCVARVRTLSPVGKEQFYVHFDAYYNAANGRVMNNVQYQGEVPALYAFNKCMSSRGISIS